jgi:ribulose-phosphate 3-epimerase
MIRAADCAAGAAINPGTPVEAIEPLIELIDVCLCMTVNPGWGGQAYIPTSTERIRRLRSLLPERVVLEVDGGISAETIGEAHEAGAELFVAGSSVFGADDPAAAFRAMAAAVGG